jgi:heme exporter protein B
VRAFGTLLSKELRVEARSREMLTGGLVLTFLILILSQLAWGDAAAPARIVPGVLWIALAFSGTLSLSRSLHRERDRGTWEALALLPVDRGTIFLAKAAANLLVLLIVAIVSLPLLGLIFDVDLVSRVASLAPVVVLGVVGLSASGTLLAAATSHARARELLLPILLFPLLVPLLMMAVQATQRVMLGAAATEIAGELALLLAFDTIFLAIGWLAFDHLLGE